MSPNKHTESHTEKKQLSQTLPQLLLNTEIQTANLKDVWQMLVISVNITMCLQ